MLLNPQLVLDSRSNGGCWLVMVKRIIYSILAWTRWLLTGTEDSITPRPPAITRQRRKDSNSHRESLSSQDSLTYETPTEQPSDDDVSAVSTITTVNESCSVPSNDASPSPNTNGLELESSSLSEATQKEMKMPSTQQSARIPQKTSHEVVKQPGGNSHQEMPNTAGAGNIEPKKPKLPRKIGGRRRPKEQKTTRQPPKPRPELICRENCESQQWEIILTAGDECQIKTVHQNGVSLDMRDHEYRLSSLTKPLQIVLESGEEYGFPLFEEKPFIFKLRNDWKDKGRKTASINRGHFLVIVPKEWERTGHVPVEPSFCMNKSFKAHYFFGEDNYLEEDIGGFSQCALPTKSIFKLTGQRVFDDSDGGELFVGAVPSLKLLQDIGWVRIGEEKKGGWKGENFNSNEQNITDILSNREGHFFIRVYDNEARQLDSGEFRYLSDLEKILVNGKPYERNMVLVPPPTGYPTINVSFISKNNTTLRPILMHDTQHTKVQGSNLIVEAHPDGDSISCKLESNTGSVDLILNLPRIWWKITSGKSDEWHDTPLVMTRQEFSKHAKLDTYIQIRLSQRLRHIGVGFNDELERKYSREGGKNGINIRLKDFIDYSQIDQRLDKDAVFNIKCDEEILTIIKISSDPIPDNVSDVTKSVTVSQLIKQTGKPTAIVRKVTGGWRRGRGFSIGEIKDAGLTAAEAIHSSISVDKRRRSTHSTNTKFIRILINA